MVDDERTQQAAMDWVDTVMRRGVELVGQLCPSNFAGQDANGTPFLMYDGGHWDRARMVDTYVAAVLEVAAAAIAVGEVPLGPEDLHSFHKVDSGTP